MQREIKFRAWVPENKSMMNAGTLEFWFQACADMRINPIKAKPGSIFMQFTGLHDKNGKEIYEGDVVRYKRVHGDWEQAPVIYHSAKFQMPNIDFGACSAEEGWEVVGNRYEHPELLSPKVN